MARRPGAEFSPVRPLTTGGIPRVAAGGVQGTIDLGLGSVDTLDLGTIVQVSDADAFREGQSVLFYLTVYNGPAGIKAGERYLSHVRLKPWWLRKGNEFRSPGMNPGPGDVGFISFGDPANYATNPPGWKPIDDQTWAGGTFANNRRCWVPEVGFVATTQWQTPPPVVAPARHTDYIFEQKVWTMDLQDPASVAAQATLLTPGGSGTAQQVVGWSFAFFWKAHGYALGLTHESTISGQGGTAPKLTLDLTWVTGTCG